MSAPSGRRAEVPARAADRAHDASQRALSDTSARRQDGQWHVRPAVADDEGAVQVLVAAFVSSFRYDGEAFAVTWPRLLGAPDAVVLVAEGETGVVGYLLALVHDTFYAGGPVAWVEEVMVDAGHRGTGVGRALMHEAERWAAQRHARLVALASRRAGPFYETLGYEAGATFYRRVLRPDDAAGSQA